MKTSYAVYTGWSNQVETELEPLSGGLVLVAPSDAMKRPKEKRNH